MKTKVTLYLFLFCLVNVVSAGEGINFFHGNWEETLAKAQMENKLIFIDVATSWCGPCKQMAANVFPDKEVGEFFNTNFINYKIDAEKGEGIQIAKEFGVREFPTYLFVNGSGVLVYRSVGYFEPIPFIGEAQIAIAESNDPEPYVTWEDRYIDGNREKKFLIGYLSKRAKLKFPSAEIVEELFPMLTSEELSNPELLSILLKNDTNTMIRPNGLLYKYVINNKQQVDSLIPTPSHYSLRTGVFNYFLNNIIANRKEDMLLDMEEVTRELYALMEMDNADLSIKYYRTLYYNGTKNILKMIQTTRDYVNNGLLKLDMQAVAKADLEDFNAFMVPYKKGERDSTQVKNWKSVLRLRSSRQAMNYSYRLRDAAGMIYKNVDDPKILEEAAEWARVSEEWFPHFSNKAVYSGLLFKLGRIKSAIALMQSASEDPFITGGDKADLLTANSVKMRHNEAPETLW